MAHLSYALNVTRPPKLFVLFSLQNMSTFPFSWNMYVLPKSFDGCDNSTICLHYSPTSVRKNKYGLFLIKMGNLVLFVSTPRSYVVLSDLEHWEQMKVLHAMLASFNIPEILAVLVFCWKTVSEVEFVSFTNETSPEFWIKLLDNIPEKMLCDKPTIGFAHKARNFSKKLMANYSFHCA